MNQQTAERWVVISAVVTAGVYFYRLTVGGGTSQGAGGLKNLLSGKPPPPLGQFATAWGFTYLIISVMAEAAPGLGGAFAILVMTADLLANTGDIVSAVGQQEKTSISSSSLGPAGAVGATPGLVDLPSGNVGAYQPPSNLNLTTPPTVGAGHQNLQ